jgi:hypothetical protein
MELGVRHSSIARENVDCVCCGASDIACFLLG